MIALLLSYDERSLSFLFLLLLLLESFGTPLPPSVSAPPSTQISPLLLESFSAPLSLSLLLLFVAPAHFRVYVASLPLLLRRALFHRLPARPQAALRPHAANLAYAFLALDGTYTAVTSC